MKSFVFNPYEGIGEISFSCERNAVRKILGEYSEFRKNQFSKNTTDDFGCCRVFYDSDNLCEAIEFSKGASSISMEGTLITDFPYDALEKFLSKKDPELKFEEDCLTSIACGISVYAPNKTVESILVFRKGYVG